MVGKMTPDVVAMCMTAFVVISAFFIYKMSLRKTANKALSFFIALCASLVIGIVIRFILRIMGVAYGY